MNYGLIIPKIETHEEGVNHVLGAAGLTEPIINESGDWTSWLPDREPQSKNGIETQACTVYGTLTALEELIYKITGVKVNYSDRYVANVAKNRGILNPYGGADPHRIAELIRTITGNLAEGRCPWTDDVKSTDDYYNIVGQELANLMSEGYQWYKEWTLHHKWVFTGGTPQEKRDKLNDARKRGTVCVSVAAWYEKDGLYYKPEGTTDNHWVNNFKDARILDSYDMYEKDLDPLYDFSLAKVYFLTPAPFLKNLYFQMMDKEVARLQTALTTLKYPIPHAVTNVYGVETRGAVASFQRDNGIVDDGSHFGPRTRYALNTKLNPAAFLGGDVWTYIASLFSGT